MSTDDSYDNDAVIARLREKLDNQLSPENRLIIQYIEAMDHRRDVQVQELIQAFRTGVGVIRVIRWGATLGAALAAIWAGIHAHVIIK